MMDLSRMQQWITWLLLCYILVLFGCLSKDVIAQDGIGDNLPNDARIEFLQMHKPSHSELTKALPVFAVNTTGGLSLLDSPSFPPQLSRGIILSEEQPMSSHGGRIPSRHLLPSDVRDQNMMSNLPHLHNLNHHQQSEPSTNLPNLHPVVTNDRPMSRKPSLEFPLKTKLFGETNREDLNVRFPDDVKTVYEDVNEDDIEPDYEPNYPEEYANNDSIQPQLENIPVETNYKKSIDNHGNELSSKDLIINGSSIENMIHFNMNTLHNETSDRTAIVNTGESSESNNKDNNDTDGDKGEDLPTPSTSSVNNALEPAGQPTSEVLVSVTPPTEIARLESGHDDYYSDYNDTVLDENVPISENETGPVHSQDSNYEYYDVRNTDDTGVQNEGVSYNEGSNEKFPSEEESNHHAEEVIPDDVADNVSPDTAHETDFVNSDKHDDKTILEDDTVDEVPIEGTPEHEDEELTLIVEEAEDPAHEPFAEEDLQDTYVDNKDIQDEKQVNEEEESSVFSEEPHESAKEVTTASTQMLESIDKSKLLNKEIEIPAEEIEEEVKTDSEVGPESVAVSYADSEVEHSYFGSENQESQYEDKDNVNEKDPNESLNSEHATSSSSSPSTTTSTEQTTTTFRGYNHSPLTVNIKPLDENKAITTTTTITTEQSLTTTEREITTLEHETTTTATPEVKITVIDENFNNNYTSLANDETSSNTKAELKLDLIEPFITKITNDDHSYIPSTSNQTENTETVVIVEPLLNSYSDGLEDMNQSNDTAEKTLIDELDREREKANTTTGSPSTDAATSSIPSTDVATSTVPSTDVATSSIPSTDVATSTVPSTDVETSTIPSTDIKKPPTLHFEVIETFHLLNKSSSVDETKDKNASSSVDYFTTKETPTTSSLSTNEMPLVSDVTETVPPMEDKQNDKNSSTESRDIIVKSRNSHPTDSRRSKINLSSIPMDNIPAAILPPGFSTEESVREVLLPLKPKNLPRGRKITSLFDQLLEKQKVNETEIPIVTDIPINLKHLTTVHMSINRNTSSGSILSLPNATLDVTAPFDVSSKNTTPSLVSTTESSLRGRRRFPSLSRKPFPFTRSGPAVTRAPFKIATRKTSDILKAKRPTLRPPGSRLTPVRSGVEYPSDPDARAEAATELVPETTTTQRIVTTLSPYFLWGQSIEVACTFKLQSGVEWIQELEDHSSTAYSELAKNVHKEINALYQRSQLADRFKGIQIEGFSKGSVIVDYTLYLTETDEFVDAELLWEATSKSLENGTNMGDYVVDPGSLSFEVIRKITPPTEISNNDNLLIPHWAIAVIVIAAASLTFLIILCLAVNRNKRGVKRKYGNPLNEDSIVERTKTWDKSAYDNIDTGTLYNINDTWDEKKLKQQQRTLSQYEYSGSHSSSGLYGMKQNPEHIHVEDPYSHEQYYDSWRSDWSRSARGSSKPPDYDTTF